jgi:beta-carotene hydroxylase
VVVDPSRSDDAWTALTHFFRSTKTQGPLLTRYRERLFRRSRAAWIHVCLQYVVVFGGHAGMCALAIALHGAGRGMLVYASALGVPAFMALWGVQFTNWVQHVSCDPDSRWDHSRNFVSPWMNALVFDNGFHTVHHERPGLHWSLARAEHARVAHLIDPRLNAESIFHYAFATYVLGAHSGRTFSGAGAERAGAADGKGVAGAAEGAASGGFVRIDNAGLRVGTAGATAASS